MSLWFIFFTPHASDWPKVRLDRALKDYIITQKEMKRGEAAYFFSAHNGFCGWGYIKDVRHADAERTFIELSFVVIKENIVTEGHINNFPELVEIRDRVEGNAIKLSRKEIKAINKILRQNNLDAPEIEVRLGRFGFKDDETLSDDLGDAINEFEITTVLFADLDNFKQVNDNFDHSTGDEVIKSALGILKDCLESKGDLFHRSDDEMIALLPNIGKSDALLICEDFRKRVELHDFVNVGKGFVSTTIGVASFPDDAHNEIDLVRLADQRAMSGKKIKRNAVYSE